MNRRDAIGALVIAGGVGAAGDLAAQSAGGAAPMPRVTSGRMERLAGFASRHVDARHVDVWLPAGYDGSRPHAVLYMHDGQMLFDPASTWNQQAWELDSVAAPLLAGGQLREFIVVGAHNNGRKRHAEYYPQQFLPHLPEPTRSEFVQRALHGQPLADAYLRFLVEELKPAIDARYRTLRGPADTFVMGSSMGGLISAYALLEYPQVFGAAAALSVHWIAIHEKNEPFPGAALAYLRGKLPAPGALRLYMDRGDTELDAQYGEAQTRIDALFGERGFKPPQWVSRVYPGTGHNERAWRDRLHIPLGFLLGA